jgi:hypothetical protein
MLGRRKAEGGIGVGPSSGQSANQLCISWYDNRHRVRKREMSSRDPSPYVRGAPPGPAGKGGGHRRCARRTANRQSVSRCSVRTKVSASMCKGAPSRTCAR